MSVTYQTPLQINALFNRLLVSLSILLNILFAIPVSATQLPLEAFANLPGVQSIKLSPSGAKIASLVRVHKSQQNKEGTAVVLYLEDGSRMVPISTTNDEFIIRWISWVNEDSLLLSARFPARRKGFDTVETRLLVLDARSGNLKNAFNKGFYRGLKIAPQLQDNVIDILPDDPSSILVSVAKTNPHYAQVFKLDINKRRAKQIQKAYKYVHDWMTDQQHRVRVGYYRRGTENKIIVKDLESGKWRDLWTFESLSKDVVWPLGFDIDPSILYVSAYHEGRLALFKVNVATKDLDLELMLSHPERDVEGSLIYSALTREVIGTRHSTDRGYTYWNKYYAAIQNQVNNALPNTSNYLIHFNQDETKFLVFSTSSTNPGEYFLGDRKKNSIVPLAYRYSNLPSSKMAPKESFTYRARDGVEIEAFLTLPRMSHDKEPIPLIVFPHGGPIHSVGLSFDYWTQFFANRGYGVLQMNFRGSSGYGYEFMAAGFQRWGQAMQDDIEDGVKAALKRGIFESQKICIVGASYGGYAALMGAIRTPGMYQCVISFAGVTDVDQLVQSSMHYTGHETVKKQIGEDRRQLQANSPLYLAKEIYTPVLLIHGESDRRVDVTHSRRLFKELTEHDKTVEYLELEKGNHFLDKNEHRVHTFRTMEAFLEKYLGKL